MKLTRLLWLAILMNSCIGILAQPAPRLKQSDIQCGASRSDAYLYMVLNKSIAVVANPSSRIGPVHLVDSLLRAGVKVKKVFAPEHGFRGEGEAGAVISDGQDPVTGIPVISLYGNHKKPTKEDLNGIDIVVFDIQDVGVRFYTYISTLHLVMEACAEEGKELLLFDRPNPNGFYIDGPVLDTAYRSFVGMDPVPVVHGMTIGEYARMINGEGWLKDSLHCNLSVIPCLGYDHQTAYVLPVKPSPNLPNQTSVYLYPSLCFFEGTIVSVGRGTEFPFQVYGHPELKENFRFTPKSIPGASLHPPFENKICFGRDLRTDGMKEFSKNPVLILDWLIDSYQKLDKGKDFFTAYFDTLAGSDQLRLQIQRGVTAEEIRAGWKAGLDKFQHIRSKYLLYPDFAPKEK